MKRANLFVFIGLALMVQCVLSSPIGHEQVETSTSVLVSSVQSERNNEEVGTPTTTTTEPPRVLSRWSGEYVMSEDEYEQILEQSAREFANSIKENPSNYVDNSAELGDILRLIEEAEERERLEREAKQEITTSTEGPPTRGEQEEVKDVLLSGAGGEAPPSPRTQPECSICLEHLREEERSMQLVCGHRFHSDCIMEWFVSQPYWYHRSGPTQPYTQSKSCPNCRRMLTREDLASLGVND